MDQLSVREQWVLWFGYATSGWALYVFFVRELFVSNSFRSAYAVAPIVVHLYIAAAIFAFVFRLPIWTRAKAQRENGDLVFPVWLVAALTVAWCVLFEILLFIF